MFVPVFACQNLKPYWNDLWKLEQIYHFFDLANHLNKYFRKCYPHAFGDIGFDNRLVICNDCIEEEERITGETKAELIGIYALLQKNYKNVLSKNMYRRFWEKALYG